MKHELTKRLWQDLYKTIDYRDMPITGEQPARKLRWLLQAIACGMQLASELLSDEIEIGVEVRPGNKGTAGEVSITFSILLAHPDYGEEPVGTLPFEILFSQPDLGEVFWVRTGNGYSRPFSYLSACVNNSLTLLDISEWVGQVIGREVLTHRFNLVAEEIWQMSLEERQRNNGWYER